MMGKLIPFKRFKTLQKMPLTEKMLASLRIAADKQSKKQPFGQSTLKGGFTSLLNRNLIAGEMIAENGILEFKWIVTSAGIKLLSQY